MKTRRLSLKYCVFLAGFAASMPTVLSQDGGRTSSYLPVDLHERFASVMARMSAAKPEIMRRHAAVLDQRYDLSNRAAPGVTMSRGKPVQAGVRVKLPASVTWESLAALSPEEIKNRDLFPQGFLPLPHANHPEGGMVFPKFAIDELKKQENRDLTRFDLDFDLPDHFYRNSLRRYYLTTRKDLGDVSHGKLVTIENYFELFNGHPESQATGGPPTAADAVPAATVQSDRGPAVGNSQPGRGLFRLPLQRTHEFAPSTWSGDMRPQEFRHRIKTVTLRGVNIQRLFGSQRALKTRGGLHRIRAARGLF